MTTSAEIAAWFDRGVEQKKTHLIVVCDTFDHDDYPVYADGDEEAWKEYTSHNGPNMQRVMEVYDLRKPKAPQLAEHRAMHLPAARTNT